MADMEKEKQERCTPLCAVDCEENLLIADFSNNRLQLMYKRGGFRVLAGVGVEKPRDVVTVDGDWFVLYGESYSVRYIQRYKIKPCCL